MKELQQVPAVIHVHTKATGGAYTPSEIARIAADNGVRAVLFSDKAERSLTYGVSPFRGVLRVTIHRDSVKMSKVDEYLKSIDEAQASNPGVVLVPGFEVAPYYRWDGDPRAGNLTINQTDCELLVYGLKKTSDWQNMPFISNPNAKHFTVGSFAQFVLCAALFAAGAAMLLKRSRQKFKVGLWRKQQIYYHRRPLRPAGVLALAMALILTAIWVPFRRYPYSQYSEPKPPNAPYQLLVDYVAKHGGVSLWAHPEVTFTMHRTSSHVANSFLSKIPGVPRVFTVTARSTGCGEFVSETQRLNGFANLDLGLKKTHTDGCRWDPLLTKYARNGGAMPFWAEAERDFYGNRGWGGFAETLTVFLIDGEPTREKILDALRAGRMYAVRGQDGKSFRLRGFKVVAGGREAISGESIEASGPVRVSGVIVSTVREGMLFRAKLIGNGQTLREFSGRTPYAFDYTFDAPEGGVYYRFEADNYGNAAPISNPIFVRRKR